MKVLAIGATGFIAGADGVVDWLSEASSGAGSNEDYGYAEFYDSV